MDLSALKKTMRAEAAARRRAAFAAAGPEAIAAANAHLIAAIGAPPPDVFSAYRPIGDELDPSAAYAALCAEGATGCLPVVLGKGRPLAFRRWLPGEALEVGSFKVEIPRVDVPATPDLLIVPLLAFDRAGYRLGYGGGFYDRTLAMLRAQGPVRAIGLAFAAQEVPEAPREPTDAPLDLIVTEAGAIVPERG
jgi:5-formyltetrahydrofolate cyclo-ligase